MGAVCHIEDRSGVDPWGRVGGGGVSSPPPLVLGTLKKIMNR